MGTLANLIENTQRLLSAMAGSVLLMRRAGTLESSNELVSAVAGPNGGLSVDCSTVEASSTYAVYAPSGALSGDVSLTGSGDGYSRCIVVGTVGTLVLTRLDGTVVTIPADIVAMNPVLNVKATLIGVTSTAQKILVLW